MNPDALTHYAARAMDLLVTCLWQSLLIAIAVGTICWLFRRRLSPGAQMLLWSLVLIRLALPTLPAAPWGWLPQPASNDIAYPSLLVTNDYTTTIVTIDRTPTLRLLPAPATASVGFYPILAIAWLGVGAALFIASVIATRRFHRLVRSESTPASESLHRVLASLNLGRDPDVLLSEQITTPVLMGVFRPTVVLPLEATRWPDARLRHVLVHELLHAKHFDVAVDWLVRLLTCIHWLNPAGWLAARQVAIAREMRRDAQALRSLATTDAESYGQTLLDLATSRRAAGVACVVAPMIGSRSALRRRIESIARPATWAGAATGVLLAFGIAFALLTSRPDSSTVTLDPNPTTNSAVAELTTTSDRGGLITSTYDLRDLLVSIPNFEYSEANALEPESKPGPTPDELLSDMQKAVNEVLKDEPRQQLVWRGPHLTATLTVSGHRKLRSAFDAMREQRGWQIEVVAKFLSVPFDDATSIQSLTNEWTSTNDRPAVALVNGAEAERRIKANAAFHLDAAPRMTLFNGQRAYVLMAPDQTYAKLSATVVNARPTLSADRQYVTCDLKLRVAKRMTAPGDNDLPRFEVATHDFSVSLPTTGDLRTVAVELPTSVLKPRGDGSIALADPPTRRQLALITVTARDLTARR